MSILRVIRDRRGTALILIALAMTVIMGASALVLDLGLAYWDSVRLQNAVDAAALAAAKDMPKKDKTTEVNKIKDKAVQYAAKNGVTITRSDVTLNHFINNEWMGVEVTASRNVNFNFARVLGINQATVTKSAEALVGALESAVGIVPLGFDYDDASEAMPGDVFVLKEGSHTDGGGWRGIVELDGTLSGGASDYEDWLATGYDGDVAVGAHLPVQNGNISGPTIDAVNDARVTQCTHHQCQSLGSCLQSDPTTTLAPHISCTYYHYIVGCPRVIVAPVITTDPTDSKLVIIQGFAVFVLEEPVEGGGTTNEIKATYVKTVTPGDGSPEMTATVHDFGAYGVRLNR